MTEQKPDDAVRSHWLAGALESMLIDRRPKGGPVTLELQTGDRPIVVAARKDGVHIDLGPVESPDATLTGPPRPVLGLLLGVLDLAGAEASGVSLEGDPAVLERVGPPAAFTFGPS